MKWLLAAALALAACDKLPERPDETKFKAMDDFDKCRATASRAILCTDELMVASVSAIAGEGIDDFSKDLAEKLASEPSKGAKADRKANIQIHKTTCAGDIGSGYVDGIFRCWAIEDCKKFAACVYERPTVPVKAPTPAPTE